MSLRNLVAELRENVSKTAERIQQSPWKYSFAIFAEYGHGVSRPLDIKTPAGSRAHKLWMKHLQKAFDSEDALRPQWRKALLAAHEKGLFTYAEAHKDVKRLLDWQKKKASAKKAKSDFQGRMAKPGEVKKGDMLLDYYITRQVLKVTRVSKKSLRVEWPAGSGKTALRKFGTMWWPEG